MHCTSCGDVLSIGAVFCSRCGTRTAAEPAASLVETQAFAIPLPEDSLFRSRALVDSLRPFTREHLWAVGVTQPRPADFYLSPGFTHVWDHYSPYLRQRLSDLRGEGWDPVAGIEPKRDAYGVLTAQAVKDAFILEESDVAGGIFGPKRAWFLTGFSVLMQRGLDRTMPTDAAEDDQ